MEGVTTVKLHKATKAVLDNLKGEQESYDDVIKKLTAHAQNQSLKKELINGYKSQGKEEINFLEEWEPASSEVE